MKAIIIAAGQGKRIPQITKKKPKCLIKINNKTIIKRQIDFFRDLKISKIAVVRGFMKKKINYKSITYYDNKNYKKNEQLDSLFYAKKFFDDDMIVCFSDIIYEKKILNQFIKTKKNFALAVDQKWKNRYINRFDHPYSQADKVLTKNGKIIKIGKNIATHKCNGEFLGIFKFSKLIGPILIKNYIKIKKTYSSKSLQMHDFLNYLVKKKITIYSSYVKGKYMEIDTFNDYQIAKKIFK
tara:strand:+ start:1032 stop:1748 length:717 start_codon:yes stop_codon:yes gene_type:complete